MTLATHSPDNSKHFRALVNRIDEIQEAYSLTGDADYVLKAVLRDLKGLSNIVNDVLMPHQSVAHVRSSIVLDRLKESSRLPLKELKAWLQIEGNSAFALRRASAMICRAQSAETAMALQLRPNCEYCDRDLPPNCDGRADLLL